MRNLQTQKGFTLVELAIVMTIIGLLIGGILKGQELMQNARITSTIAQVRAYEAATTTFRDKYDAIPGDMANAQTRIPGCPTTPANICNPTAGVPTASVVGDSIVGSPTWGAGGWANQAGTVANNETMLFWTHLLLSDLISGVTNAAVTGGTVASGETHPAAKIGGVFIVGFGDGTAAPGTAGPGPSGMILVLNQQPTSVLNNTAGVARPLTPTRAAQIDRKMDDGRPGGGFVHAFGSAGATTTNACMATGGTTYNESVTVAECGLIFRIQG